MSTVPKSVETVVLAMAEKVSALLQNHEERIEKLENPPVSIVSQWTTDGPVPEGITTSTDGPVLDTTLQYSKLDLDAVVKAYREKIWKEASVNIVESEHISLGSLHRILAGSPPIVSNIINNKAEDETC